MECVTRGAYEGESYRRRADERRRDDERTEDRDARDALMYALRRGVKALESIADAIERISPKPSAEEAAARARLQAMMGKEHE